MKSHIKQYFNRVAHLIVTTELESSVLDSIAQAAQIMIDALKSGHKIITCGNGGSMADAQHFAAELVGKYKDTRDPLPAIALSDSVAMSCIGNDFGYEAVFRRQVYGLGNPGDVLFALSTSGRSPNVINAMSAARSRNMNLIVITGEGPMFYEDVCTVRIPSTETCHIQEVTIMIIHILVELIEKELKLTT